MSKDMLVLNIVAIFVMIVVMWQGQNHVEEYNYNLGYAECKAGFAHRYPKEFMPNFKTQEQKQ